MWHSLSFLSTQKYLRRFLFEGMWLFGVGLAGLAIGFFSIYYFGTPDVASIGNFPFQETTILYDRTGTHELYRVFGEENRVVIDHGNIPALLRAATVASEDANFYAHQGVDFPAIVRAIAINLKSGEIEQGASTITQQVARNLLLSRERTWKRKIREMFLAIKIDRHLNKETILDLYLNAVPYGANAYGVEAAAQTYFHKPARDLTLDESALLAALPNAPTLLSPYGEHRNELVARQRAILKKMRVAGVITEAAYASAIATETLANIRPLERSIFAPHFVLYTLEQLVSQYGKERLQTEGLRVLTTLDYELQQTAEQAVTDGVRRNIARNASNAALVSIDATTGDILAMAGSRDYFDTAIDGNVNVTVQKRQPGSAFKPFAYAAAFEQGFQPETVLYDVPTNFGPDGSGKDYLPENYDGTYHGPLSMRQTLAMSLNIPAVQTLALAGVGNTIGLATRLGITTLSDPDRYGLALVLGGAEVRPLDMASAFSVFGQEGLRHIPKAFSRIIDRSGRLLFDEAFAPKGEQVLDIEVARKINAILSDNTARAPIFGTHSPLAFPTGVAVAAKTGTTQNFRDAWTVGYTTGIAVAVWVGNNDNRPMKPGSDGIYVAAPIFRDFLNIALARFPGTGFTPYTPHPPVSIVREPDDVVYIDTKTGREVSEKKAKKLKKKGRLEIRSREGIPLTPLSGEALENIPYQDIETLKRMYESARSGRSPVQ